MTILSSKWMIGVLVLISILIILYLIGRKSVHTEITIDASPNKVWAALTDLSKVNEWNKVLVPVEGELKEGSTIKYEFYQDESGKATVMDASVKQLVKNKLINQKGGMPGILTFDHQYILEQTTTGTKVQIHEEYRGIMVPFWNPQPVEKAYERLLKSLEERVTELKKKDELNS